MTARHNAIVRWWRDGWQGGSFKSNRLWHASSTWAAIGGLAVCFGVFLALQYWK